jgi:uncharacterized protein
MDSKKVIVRETGKYGKGVFAVEPIKKDEVLAECDGEIFTGEYDDWTDDQLDHAIQFAPLKWRESKGIFRDFNHSCEPNCGIKNLFQVVAMRDIAPGEELKWDYEMTENNYFGWKMECQCGTPSCRKLIGRYDDMPQTVREKYKGYISEWLLTK